VYTFEFGFVSAGIGLEFSNAVQDLFASNHVVLDVFALDGGVAGFNSSDESAIFLAGLLPLPPLPRAHQPILP
jgi:hypothetical protein